jgi:hypothetical protein
MRNINKIKKTNFLFLLFTLFTLIFAGCSKIPECTLKDTTYEKYKLNEETNTCELYKKIEKNQCGNSIAEKDNDETSCNCPEDISDSHPTLGCNGELGEYLEYTCTEEKTCELQQNKKVIEQTKPVEFKNTDLTFRANYKINTPFILDTIDKNTISVNLDYFKGPSSNSIKLKNIVVKEMTLKNSKSLTIGTQVYEEQVSSIGKNLKLKQFELAQTIKYESLESLKAELVIFYTKDTYDYKGEISKSEEKIETLKASLGTWIIINPNFEVPE